MGLSIIAMSSTILYVDCSPNSGIDRRRLDGMRRYAATRKWRVEILEHRNCSSAALREALAQLRPIGCAAECWCPETAPRPALFGRVPVVYFSPPDRPGWRDACGVSCDEAAVAKMAFGELSSTDPPSYAVVSFSPERRWARERVKAFLECCRNAGVDCSAFRFPLKAADDFPDCVSRMVPWAASLPQRCAVFAVNDLCAIATAEALAEARRSFPRTVTLVGADGDDPPSWDRETAEAISSVRLDHEQAGYLAAKMIGEFFSHGDTEARRKEQTDLLTPNGVRDTGNVSRVSGEQIRLLTQNTSEPSRETLVFPPLLVDRRKSTRGYGRREPRILEAMEMIRREACDGLTVAKLARRFPGTRRLFDMRFREAAGHSALDEILNVRMARAMELLTNTDMPISAIAHFSGFKTEWDFWKRFSKRVGMPPLRFRSARR